MKKDALSTTDMKTNPKKKKWLSYLFRGVEGVIVAVTLAQQLIEPTKVSYFPAYLGFYFLANGALSFKMARSAPNKKTGDAIASIASIVGGLLLVVFFYLFSSYYRGTGTATDLGRYVFSAIVIVIGLLQVQGAVHMTPEPIEKNAHLVFGFLELLLGFVIIVTPVSWDDTAVAFAWTIIVTLYMFYVAHRIHST